MVWFKRDLRAYDHAPLVKASEQGKTLCLYVIEPRYWQLADTSNRQWLFVRESLVDLQQQLKALGGNLVVRIGDMTEVLSQLLAEFDHFNLFSHEETGNLWTFERDLAVKAWCQSHQVSWQEYAQNGVKRPLHRRQSNFKPLWDKWVKTPLLEEPEQITFAHTLANLPTEQWPESVCDDPYPCRYRQTGGRAKGIAIIESFLGHRGRWYRGSVSSPLTAEEGCSRLSAHLAYGCVSLKEVTQAVFQAKQMYQDDGQWQRSLSAFYSRLWWHCYFTQALECFPQMENRCVVSEMAELKRPFDAQRLAAWQQGRTGWPLVDACMRYLHKHGWVNFRMRAMLVSVATYSLSLPWKPVADWLAHLFVDYEPGIHYPQIQMQSGTSSMSIVRVYNPVSQAQRLDAKGEFVRRWVPELRGVSDTWIFEPWRMPDHLWPQGQPSYPKPLVDFEQAHREAKKDITRIREKYGLVSKSAEKRRAQDSRKQKATRLSRKRQVAKQAGQMSLFD